MSAKLELIHKDIIKEEQLNISELPENIKNLLKGINKKIKDFESIPDEEEGKKDFGTEIENLSVKIGDMIQDFIENDFEGEPQDYDDDNEENERKENERKENERKENERKENERKENERKKISFKPSENTIVKIINYCEKNGNRISYDQLKTIIGKDPNYPEHKIGNLILRRVFLSSSYYIKNRD